MIKRFFTRIIYGINIVIAVLFLISFIIPLIAVKSFPILAVISLGIPLLMLANVLFVLFWIWKTKKYFVVSLMVLIASFLVFDSIYQYNSKVNIAASNTLEVMSYNTRLFNKYRWKKQEGVGEAIVKFVNENPSDVLLFQEFNYAYKDSFSAYPYRVFSTSDNSQKAIQAIFSKYPIKSSKTIDFPSSSNAAIYADVEIGSFSVRLFNIHLQSLRVSADPEVLKQEETELLIQRLSRSFTKQEQQAEIIANELNQSPYYNILGGDFNNTQYSRIYQLIKGEMNDSFIERGNGFGRSFDFKLFPMRIDFLMADPELNVVSHQNYDVSYSDHFPIKASFSL